MISKFENFWSVHDWPRLQRVNSWTVSREGERVFLQLPAKDSDIYRILFVCNNYPEDAPSVAFVNAEGSKLDPKAWPKGTSQFFEIVKPPPNCFLCTELTREGLSHHADWKSQSKAWNGDRNTLMDCFNLIHRLLQWDQYMGRGGT